MGRRILELTVIFGVTAEIDRLKLLRPGGAKGIIPNAAFDESGASRRRSPDKSGALRVLPSIAKRTSFPAGHTVRICASREEPHAEGRVNYDRQSRRSGLLKVKSAVISVPLVIVTVCG